jgi:hypothetical protein
MRYILFMDHNKTPVKREDINKNVLQEHKNITKVAISQAQKKFSEVSIAASRLTLDLHYHE